MLGTPSGRVIKREVPPRGSHGLEIARFRGECERDARGPVRIAERQDAPGQREARHLA